MIVERLEITNWRAFREPHTFEFRDDLNLLVGPNEAGKSTLFEALQRAIFDRHSGHSQDIRSMQPLASSLGPEVELIVRDGSRRYKIHKRFLDKPMARLYSERDGEWELDHDGDGADDAIRDLLQGDAPHGAAKEEHRGLAQALWYLQREPALPRDRWNEAVEKGLEGVIEVATTSPAEDAVIGAIDEEYSEHWTPTGRVSKKSELHRLKEELPKLEEDLATVQARLTTAADLRGELDQQQASRQQKSAELEREKEELTALKEAVEAGRELEQNRARLEQEIAEARQGHEEAKKDLQEIERLEEELDRLEAESAEAREESSRAEFESDQAKRRSQQLRDRRRQELLPAERKTRERLDALTSLQELRSIEARQKRASRDLASLEEAEEALREKKQSLSELNAPDSDAIAAFEETTTELRVAEEKAEAAAIRVAFDLSGDHEIEPEPEAEIDEGEYLVTRPTSFRLGDLGTVTVRGGGETLEELETQVDDLHSELQRVLRRYGVEEREELRSLHEERTVLEDEIEKLQAEIESLQSAEDVSVDAVAELEERIRELSSKTEDLEEEDLELDEQALEERIEELTRERDRLQEEIAGIEDQREEAAANHLSLVEEAQDRANRVSELEATIRARRQDKARILDAYGTRNQLENELSSRQEAVADLEARLQELDEQYRDEVERPRELVESTRERIDSLKVAIAEIDGAIPGIKDRIEEIANEGNYAKLGELEARLEHKRRRHQVVERRAEAAKLLQDVHEAFQKQRATVLAGPISETMNGWISTLTDGRYDDLEFDQNLFPTRVRSTRYGEHLSLVDLSFGTHEQINVLFRLAIAKLLSEDQRHLVVLDDRLVNTDPLRSKRLVSIFEEVATSAQILLATCNDTRYAGLDAHRIQVPRDGLARSS